MVFHPRFTHRSVLLDWAVIGMTRISILLSISKYIPSIAGEAVRSRAPFPLYEGTEFRIECGRYR
jgi:hypothetical protein